MISPGRVSILVTYCNRFVFAALAGVIRIFRGIRGCVLCGAVDGRGVSVVGG